ncbi:MAG: hypothetical protein QOJ02_548 [Acidobacteriota bacterium]|jgi:hypothetical protein|nr:hypothetical protein [Acidobacteriota bacterium]
MVRRSSAVASESSEVMACERVIKLTGVRSALAAQLDCAAPDCYRHAMACVKMVGQVQLALITC